MVIENAHYTKALVECCYRVLDGLNGCTDAEGYRALLSCTASSLGLNGAENVVHWLLMETGAIKYKSKLKFYRTGHAVKSVVSDTSEISRNRWPKEGEMLRQTERYAEVVETRQKRREALALYEQTASVVLTAQALDLPWPTVKAWIEVK